MIGYGKQSISIDDIRAVESVLQSNYLTQGPKVRLRKLCWGSNMLLPCQTAQLPYYACHVLGVRWWVTQTTLGISQLRRLDTFISRRRAIVKAHEDVFKGLGIVGIGKTPKQRSGYHQWHNETVSIPIGKFVV